MDPNCWYRVMDSEAYCFRGLVVQYIGPTSYEDLVECLCHSPEMAGWEINGQTLFLLADSLEPVKADEQLPDYCEEYLV